MVERRDTSSLDFKPRGPPNAPFDETWPGWMLQGKNEVGVRPVVNLTEGGLVKVVARATGRAGEMAWSEPYQRDTIEEHKLQPGQM